MYNLWKSTSIKVETTNQIPDLRTKHLKLVLVQAIDRARNAHRPPLLRVLKRRVEPETLARRVRRNAAIWIRLRDQLLAPRIHKKANQIRTHVVAAEVGERLCQMCLVEIDLQAIVSSSQAQRGRESRTSTNNSPSKFLSGFATSVPSGL